MRATKIALDFAKALTEKFVDEEQYPRNSTHISVIPGHRFDKLVCGSRSGEQTLVYAFIERDTGDLYRAASWGRPEPLVRYSSENLMSSALLNADPYAMFLTRG